jgi:hypothetical protein
MREGSQTRFSYSGARTLPHLRLTAIPEAQAKEQISASKKKLEDLFRVSATSATSTADVRAVCAILSNEPARQPQSLWTSASTPKCVILSPSEGSARNIPRVVFATSLRCSQRGSCLGFSGSARGGLAPRVTTVASRLIRRGKTRPGRRAVSARREMIIV